MSCPEKKDECSPPSAKQRRVLETDEKNNGVLDLADSQEAEAAQTLWEMTNWRENADDKEQPGNVIPHTPENGTAEDSHARLPVCTPERGDTGESATGTPHIPEGGETGEKNTTPSKQDPLRRDAAGNGDPDDQRKRSAQPNLEIADAEEPAVLSPLSSDSEAAEHRSCSEGDECCIVSVGTQPTSNDRSLQALESVQQELRSVNERADRALLQLKRRYGQLRKPHIQKRNSIIRTIPGFWVTAFLNHPQLSAMIDDRDEDTLSYMNNLQVEDFTHLKSSCKIKFYFNSNPYFKNDVIIKEFQYGSSGRLTSHSTPIQWWRGQNPSHSGKNSSTPSFFSWFSDHSFPAADRIATIIKEDLWPNPLQYYLIGEGESDDHPAEDSDPDNTDDCVVIVDDDDDDDDEEDGVEENEEDDDDENDVHEISDNTEKHTEGTDNDDDDDDEEDLEEESVPEELVESTVVDETDNIVLDADDSENSSEEGGDSE
ncbi:putative testis-specific Y-encoded-like protein 3 [Bufo bufo]|uniref:putative testis-specific Y-encoded-like protein 3 n=1 Tax=Bufo bufo TaxID=8384 RepID=UPI001ABDFE6E|nr:putative testis-specific Y-encoded-like protein 3 [Bufo bufo]